LTCFTCREHTNPYQITPDSAYLKGYHPENNTSAVGLTGSGAVGLTGSGAVGLTQTRLGGGGGYSGSTMVHNPTFDFNDSVLTAGAKFYVHMVAEKLQRATA
jgi:hypothetical protein